MEGSQEESSLEEQIVDKDGQVRRSNTEQRLRYLWLASSMAIVGLLGYAVVRGILESGYRGIFVYLGLFGALISMVFASSQLLAERPRLENLKHEATMLKVQAKLAAASVEGNPGAARRMYKQDASESIDQFRASARTNRRIHNYFQSVIIIGSVALTGITSAALDEVPFGWVAAVLSAIVSISAGMTAYFKFRDRSFGQQQTADAIEKELRSVELVIWDYAKEGSSAESLALFAERVEALKEEQRKRELQLEQSTDRQQGQPQQAPVQ